jgi:hypothetical protein
MSTLYIQYPQNAGGGGTTGSQTGVPYVVGPLNGAAKNAQGGVIGSFSFYQQSADAVFPGLVSSADQTFSGVKTFLSAPILNSLAQGPLRVGPGNALSIGSTNLSSEVVGVLPSANGGTGTSNSWTQGSVIFADVSNTLTQNNSQFFWNNTSFRLGLGTNLPSSSLSFDGDSNKTIALERSLTTAGAALTIEPGGSLAGLTDSAGGNLILRSGKSTGTGASSVIFQTYTSSATTGASDNIVSTKMTLTSSGFLGIGTGNPTVPLALGGNRTLTSAIGATVPSLVDFGAPIFTDPVTSGTVTNLINARMGNLTYLSTSSVTVTTVAGLRIGVPGAGNVNVAFTSTYGIFVPSLNVSTGSSTVTNSYALSLAAMTGAANNYAATISGNVGMGGVTDPMAMLEIAATTKQVGSSEQLSFRSQRTSIVSGDMIGGVSYRSNDSNLTAPGTVVALTDAVAEATHTAAVLDTGLAFYTTKTLLLSESMRISAAGFVGIGKTSPTVSLDVRGNLNINGSTSGFFGLRAADSAGSTTYTWATNPGTNGQFLQSNGVGSLTFATITSAPSLTIGSVTQTSSAGGAAYTIVWPGSQGGANTAPFNDGAGNLSWRSLLPNPMTTSGDIIVSSGAGVAVRLALGAAGTMLTSDPTAPQGLSYQGSPNFQNYLVNSAFDYYQSIGSGTATISASPTLTTYTGCDQWWINAVVGSFGFIVSKTNGSLLGSRYGLVVQCNSIGNATSNDSSRAFVGQLLRNTSSFPLYGKRASAAIQVKALLNETSINIAAITNQTESIQTPTVIASATVTINSATFTNVTLNNFLVGTAHGLAGIVGFQICTQTVSSGSIQGINSGYVLEQGMLNLGPSAQPFSRQYSDPSSEFNSCLQFYEKSYDQTVKPGDAQQNGMFLWSVTAASNGKGAVPFKISKRTVATVSFWDAVGNISKDSWWNGASLRTDNNNTASTNIPITGNNGLNGFGVNDASATAVSFGINWVADARMG